MSGWRSFKREEKFTDDLHKLRLVLIKLSFRVSKAKHTKGLTGLSVNNTSLSDFQPVEWGRGFGKLSEGEDGDPSSEWKSFLFDLHKHILVL